LHFLDSGRHAEIFVCCLNLLRRVVENHDGTIRLKRLITGAISQLKQFYHSALPHFSFRIINVETVRDSDALRLMLSD